MAISLRQFIWAGVACLAITASSTASAQRDDRNAKDEEARRPKLTLKAQPVVSMSPSRVVLTAELVGGANDYEAFYCPTVVWDWGDGTQSQSTFDCEPYQPGKSEIRRRFVVEHVFRAGSYRVMFRLKRHDKELVSAGTNVRVQPGLSG